MSASSWDAEEGRRSGRSRASGRRRKSTRSVSARSREGRSSEGRDGSARSAGASGEVSGARDRGSWRERRRASARMAVSKDAPRARRERRADSARRMKVAAESAERVRSQSAERERTRSAEREREESAERVRSQSAERRRRARQEASDSAERERRKAEEAEVGRLAKVVLLGVAVVLVLCAGAILLKEDRTAPAPRLTSPNLNPNPSRDPIAVAGGPGVRPTERAPDSQIRRPGEALPTQPQEVAGRVVDRDGRAISPASLRGLRPRAQLGQVNMEPIGLSFVTDIEGGFQAMLDPRARLLEVQAQGYATRLVPLDTAAGPAWKALEIQLSRAVLLEGQVVAAETGAPITGALIAAEGGSWRGETRSDGGGRFRFEDAPQETIAMLVQAPGRIPAVVDAAPNMTIPLMEGRGIRGRVIGPQGQPVSDAEVIAFGSEHPGVPLMARSDASGAFEVSGLDPEEEFVVHARKDNWVTFLVQPWNPPSTGEVEVALREGADVEVLGLNLEYVELLPLMVQPGFDSPQAVASPGGLRYSALPPGSYELIREGSASPPIPIELGPGQQLQVEAPPDVEALPPEPGGEALAGAAALQDAPPILVRVVDQDGRGLPGAIVHAEAGLRGQGTQSLPANDNGLVEVPRSSTVMMIQAEAPGRMLVAPVEVRDGEQEVTLVMVEPATLRGRLQPATSAQILLVDPLLGQSIRVITCGEDGNFTLEGVAPGQYILEVTADKYAVEKVGVQLPVRGDVLTIPLHEGGQHHHYPQGQ